LIVLMLLAVSLTTLSFYRHRLGAVAAAPSLPDAPLPTPRHYQAEVESAEFEAFWTSLNGLDVDQLPSAYAGGRPGDGAELGQPRLRVIDGLTYEFTVQTQEPAFKHQFQVYGPAAVADRRYEAITTEFYVFLKTVFGDRPFTESA
jgi:hypothetical protein